MHEVGHAELLGGGDDEIAAGNVVGIDGEVGRAFNDVGVFVGLAHKEHDVGALFTDALEGGGGAGNALVHDDGLHVGVVGEGDDLGNGGFHFRHEVVGIGDVLDHAAVGDVTVLFDESFCSAQVVLGLGHRAGADADVDFGRLRGGSLGGEGHHAQTHGCKKTFHLFSLLEKIRTGRPLWTIYVLTYTDKARDVKTLWNQCVFFHDRAAWQGRGSAPKRRIKKGYVTTNS